MTDEKGFSRSVAGPLEMAFVELIQIDMSAGAVVVMMKEFEEDIAKLGWDVAPCLFSVYRLLPPRELADEFSAIGVMASQMLQLKPLRLDWQPDWHPVEVVSWLAKRLKQDRKIATAVVKRDAENDPEHFELFGWMLCNEAWSARTNEEELEVPPSERPDRVETRVVTLIDRAGYLYQLYRYRNTEGGEDTHELIMDFRDEGKEPVLQGRVPEAMIRLMDATPSAELD